MQNTSEKNQRMIKNAIDRNQRTPDRPETSAMRMAGRGWALQRDASQWVGIEGHESSTKREAVVAAWGELCKRELGGMQ